MERPVKSVLVTNDTGGLVAATTTIADFIGSTGDVGELGIFNADNNQAVTGAGNLPQRHYYAVKVSDSQIKKSPVFDSCPAFIASTASASGTAQVNTISSFTGDCETEYIIKVRLESEKIFETYGYQDLVKTYSYVTRCCSDACGCPEGAAWDVAMGIAENINADLENALFTSDASEFLIGLALPINSAAVTATNDFDDNVTIVKGSDTITTAGGWDHSDGGTYDGTLVAGDFVRISDVDGTAPTTADPIYRVESVSGTTVVLDRPVEMPSRTGTGGNSTDFEVITKAVGEAFADSSWSISIAGGQHATPAVGALSTTGGVFNNNLISAHIGLLGGFDCNGTVAETTAMVTPKGQDWQISQLEIENAANTPGSRSTPYRTPFPLTNLETGESLVGSGDTYQVVAISYIDQHTSGGDYQKSPMTVYICCEDGGGNTTKSNLEAILNTWQGITIPSNGFNIGA